MRRLVVVMPNTLSRAYEAIDALADDGTLRPDDCSILKALYADGWQDGFVAGPLASLAASLGISNARLRASIAALSKIHAVGLRSLPDEDLSLELLALSRPWVAGDVALGWWRYHVVDEESEQIDGPSAA